jgi:hypothetical protein
VEIGTSSVYFLANSLANNWSPDCPITHVMYETASGSETASTDFVGSASATPVSGSEYHAVPVNAWTAATLSMSIKITFTGGGVYRYAPCTLDLVCGLSSQSLTFSSYTHEFGPTLPAQIMLTLNSGVSDQFTINFAKFTSSNLAGCPIVSYSLLDASYAAYTGLAAPVMTTTGYSITVPTDLLANRTFLIRASAEGGVSSDSPPIDIRVVCGSETLKALNQTPTELVVSKNALDLFPILPNWAGYWQTDKA